MSEITIVATTWLPPGNERARLEALKRAVNSWWLKLYGAAMRLHVVDDGTDPYWFTVMQNEVKACWLGGYGNPTFSQQQRRGVGASLNAGLEEAFKRSPIVLYAVDDWELLQPLDLTPWVAMMEDLSYYPAMIRFFPHPDLTGVVKHVPPHGWAVEIENHHFAFGFRPALWHARMFLDGKFKEGLSSFDTEIEFNQRWCNSPNVAKIYLALPEAWRPIETGSLAGIVPG